MTTLTFRGRLPGVDCSPALPPAEQPIRLDVAALVGFAERGPVDTPVAVADVAAYEAVFGGEFVLAGDAGRPVYAQLGQAVKAFFDNGGVRCYAVRVTGPARTTAHWVLPNLAIWFPDADDTGAVAVEAAWPGAWSAELVVSALPYARPLATVASYQRAGVQPGELRLSPGVAAGVRPGDLLELDLGGGSGLYVAVSAVAGGSVRTDREVLARPGSLPADRVPDAAGRAALPSVLGVRTVRLHRLDLLVQRRIEGQLQQVERFDALSFGSAAAVLQPAGATAPDLSRSLNLRADAATEALLDVGLLVPLAGAGDGVLTPGADDLDTFDPPAVFLDGRLTTSTVHSLLPDADTLTSLAAVPARLRGIHCLLGVEDVAMIALPDLAQRGWEQAPVLPADPPPPPPPPPLPPDWSQFACCPGEPPDAATVTDPAPDPPATPAAALGPVRQPVASYDVGPLLAVQRALITLCAARADMSALLSVPVHFDAAATVDWQAQLTASGSLAASTTSALTPLSYAAYWHPWLTVPEPTTPQLAALRELPPDGAVAGMIAARELARGVWLAPAYQPLHAAVGLEPTFGDADAVRLFDAHACLIRQRPGSFAPIAAHTLADGPLLQLSVRRLLIWLRKIALRTGQRYVFDVSNDRFRDVVRSRFQRIVDQLIRLGALHAGQVIVDNSAAATENGQLIVSLQVAPSSPVEFVTVTLVRTGEALLEVGEA